MMCPTWWSAAQFRDTWDKIPTVSRLKLYLDEPPDFTYDFDEWCCAREQLWAIKKKMAERPAALAH